MAIVSIKKSVSEKDDRIEEACQRVARALHRCYLMSNYGLHLIKGITGAGQRISRDRLLPLKLLPLNWEGRET